MDATHLDAGEIGRRRAGLDLAVEPVERLHLDQRARGDAYGRGDVGMPAIVAFVGLAHERHPLIDMDMLVGHAVLP